MRGTEEQGRIFHRKDVIYAILLRNNAVTISELLLFL